MTVSRRHGQAASAGQARQPGHPGLSDLSGLSGLSGQLGGQLTVLGKQVERARREHKLSISILAMLSGLTDAQVQGIEESTSAAFVDEAHCIDCARRIAIAMGLPPEHFLQIDAATAAQPTDIRQRAGNRLPRAAWEHLPVAGLDALSGLRATEVPDAPVDQRRQGSPLLIALVIALVLTGLLFALATLP